MCISVIVLLRNVFFSSLFLRTKYFCSLHLVNFWWKMKVREGMCWYLLSKYVASIWTCGCKLYIQSLSLNYWEWESKAKMPKWPNASWETPDYSAFYSFTDQSFNKLFFSDKHGFNKIIWHSYILKLLFLYKGVSIWQWTCFI